MFKDLNTPPDPAIPVPTGTCSLTLNYPPLSTLWKEGERACGSWYNGLCQMPHEDRPVLLPPSWVWAEWRELNAFVPRMHLCGRAAVFSVRQTEAGRLQSWSSLVFKHLVSSLVDVHHSWAPQYLWEVWAEQGSSPKEQGPGQLPKSSTVPSLCKLWTWPKARLWSLPLNKRARPGWGRHQNPQDWAPSSA